MIRSLIFLLIGCLSFNSYAQKTAIASGHPLATAAGFEVLAKGGNVFDAAVAVSAALAVVQPSGSGLGGGGYWLLHRADGTESFIDGREKAPLAATATLYLDKNGNVLDKLSLEGGLSAGIPGLPAALVYIAKKYGRLPLSQSLAPAIRYADYGFAIGKHHRRLLALRLELLKKYSSTAKIFLHHGDVPELYSVLKQPDLAETLRQLAHSGHGGFYHGKVAKQLIKAVQAAGGIWTQADLDAYQIVERKPIIGHYHGIKITSAAPSSSGGIVLVEALNILSGYDLMHLDDVTGKHLVIEAMRHAYHDRALYLGDADFISIPVQRLLSPDYAAGLRSSIRLDKALSSDSLSGELFPITQGTNTTHFSIIDQQGNRVAATLSINFAFGSGLVAEGTGVLLNDEMDDFASSQNTPNGFGLIGGTANAIAPGKRMLSSMTPTFLEDEQRIAVLGTPGGSRIISMVLLAILEFAQGKEPASWLAVPRYHHQFMPDYVEYEQGAFTATELSTLELKGHKMQMVQDTYGDMHAVLLYKNTHKLIAASDQRGEGKAIVK